jgi:hypothetical protein
MNNTICFNKENFYTELFDVIYGSVLEYLFVLKTCFNKSFGETTNLILLLVGDYFNTFTTCFNNSLEIIKSFFEYYFSIDKLVIKEIFSFPNNLLITIILISLIRR